MTRVINTLFAQRTRCDATKEPNTRDTRVEVNCRHISHHPACVDGRNGTGAHLDNIRGDGAAGLVAVFHVSLEVDVEKLADKVELLIGMNNVEEPTWRGNKTM